MMSDYDRTLELQEAAYNSVGQSTVQYKINQIKNSWERLRVSLLDQNVYKGALDKGNQLLSSIKEGFSLKDLAFIGVIGLTVGKTFITQMIKIGQYKHHKKHCDDYTFYSYTFLCFIRHRRTPIPRP